MGMPPLLEHGSSKVLVGKALPLDVGPGDQGGVVLRLKQKQRHTQQQGAVPLMEQGHTWRHEWEVHKQRWDQDGAWRE